MANVYPNDDLLIRYLDGELSRPERAQLEADLNADEALRTRLTNLQVAIQAIRHLGTAEQVATVHTEMMAELRTDRKLFSLPKFIRYTMAVAASLLVLFFCIRLYLNNQGSPDRLYAKAFVDFTVSVNRGGEVAPSAIEQHYARKEYSQVTTMLRSRQLDAKDSLLIGLSFLHLNRPAQAALFFAPLASTANDYQPDAEFYLALSYLKNKDYRRSLPLLKKIQANTMHVYHERVSEEMVERIQKLSRD